MGFTLYFLNIKVSTPVWVLGRGAIRNTWKGVSPRPKNRTFSSPASLQATGSVAPKRLKNGSMS
jgi:hypothetical protein